MENKGTILFVMPRLPFPMSSGRKNSLYNYCRILSVNLGYRLVVAAFLESGDDTASKPDFIDRLVVLPDASLLEKMKNILLHSVLRKEKPLQVSLYLSAKAGKRVKQIVYEEKPDIVIGDMIRSIDYIVGLPAYRISDLDDRISLRYQRQLEADFDNINPYGALLDRIPAVFHRIMLFKPVKSLVVKREIELLNKYELEMGKRCEKTIFVAQTEVDTFNAELGEEKAIAVPIGVDTDCFSYRECGKDGNYIGFLGALNVAHNDSAVRYFIRNIFPKILVRHPNAIFMVIGGGASDDLKKMGGANVEFTGRVHDVREYLEKCKVFVCPMTFGSGIKTKNLEAMALGVPIVTTSIGAENISAKAGLDWMVEDYPDEFANKVIELLENSKLQHEMGINGSRYVNQNFTWNVAERQFIRLLEDANESIN